MSTRQLLTPQMVSLSTNNTDFHEWGAASPQILLVGIIRAYSRHSWLDSLNLQTPTFSLGLIMPTQVI
jgi:hypothetical protein